MAGVLAYNLAENDEKIKFDYENSSFYENSHEIEGEIEFFCKEARSLKEILEYCGYKNARSFREKYINPLLKDEKLKMTIPEQPKNRNQKYISSK